ncbi:relaxase/mobilization nuclease domain-containing protein [Bacteroides xylanisolvens]|nr:relaxase/mobilization nuclease domain-containing protein [Bacteroides xylanisolvens]
MLTDEQLTAIGQEYMEKMGYGNQPYIIYRHEDIGRPHIHIVSLRIDEQGKKIKDYKEWQRSTAVCGSWRGNTICYPPRRWSDGNPCR